MAKKKKRKSLERDVFVEEIKFGVGIKKDEIDDDDDNRPWKFPKTRKFNNELYMYGWTAYNQKGFEWDKDNFKKAKVRYRTVSGKKDGKKVYRIFGRVKDLNYFNLYPEKLYQIRNEYKKRKKKITRKK